MKAKAPWIIHRAKHRDHAGASDEIYPSGFDPEVCPRDRPARICEVRCSHPDNARILPLLAAAPEMLAALHDALAEVEEYATIAKPPIKRHIERVAREVRAAIAAAERTT